MLETLLSEVPTFLDKISVFSRELGIDISLFSMDHIGLRFKNATDVDLLANELKTCAVVLSEAEVNGRKIYNFKLQKFLTHKSFVITCIELPYPAASHCFPNDGWEHAEFIIHTDTPNNFETIFKKKFPHLSDDVFQKYSYTFSIPKINQPSMLNPIVSLTKYPGLTIKFHPYSIEEIIASEL